ncbi:MAG: hypothetical protein V1855_02730 [bacterium]
MKLKQREAVLHQVTQSFRNLLKDESVRHKPLAFLGLPVHWFAMGTAQAVWLLTGDNAYPVYQFCPVISLQGGDNYLKVPALDKNYMKIERIENSFVFTSLDPEKLWFERDGKKISKENVLIPEKYYGQDLVYIVWDYQNAMFKVLR